MRIRPHERQAIVDICREEMGAAAQRIDSRLAQLESRPVSGENNAMESVRRFYEDLSDRPWVAADEEALAALGEATEAEIKQMMREGFRRSRVHPVPSFVALINILKKAEEKISAAVSPSANPDAISAAERERLANLLYTELAQAARLLSSRLQLNETKAEIVREQLEDVQGHIIGRFTPLV
jgi:hypothetical protein